MRNRLALLLLILFAVTSSGCTGSIVRDWLQLREGKPQTQPERRILAGRVVRVIDGDTVTVLDSNKTEKRVRLAGIDAPEAGQDFAQASKNHLSGLVFNMEVEVLYSKLDQYDRILGVLYVDGRNINLAQVRSGLAWHYKEYQSEQTQEERIAYTEAEERAREKRSGLWQQPDPIKPSEFRRRARADTESR